MSVLTVAATTMRGWRAPTVFDVYCRPVSCLARSAAASADLELDALLLLREANAVRDKNNTATIFECGAA